VAAKLQEIAARELERFVVPQNIEHYTHLLTKSTDAAERSILEKLLVEERAKLEFSADGLDTFARR
jgi:hypothetical protein